MRLLFVFLLLFCNSIFGQKIILTYESIPSFVQIYQDSGCINKLIRNDTVLCFELELEGKTGGYLYVAYSSPQNGQMNISNIWHYIDTNLVNVGNIIVNTDANPVAFEVCFDLFNSYIDNFCPYYIPGMALKVHFGELQVSQQETNILFVWSTYSEVNSSEFELEVSLDLVTWVKMGTYPAKGNSTYLTTYYQTIPNLPESGIWYARIIEVDLNGIKAYFDPVYFSYVKNRTVLVWDEFDLSGRRMR